MKRVIIAFVVSLAITSCDNKGSTATHEMTVADSIPIGEQPPVPEPVFRKVVAYKIITNNDRTGAKSFSDVVNDEIKAGWEPQGGIQISSGAPVAQAMVKFDR